MAMAAVADLFAKVKKIRCQIAEFSGSSLAPA